MFTIRPAEPGDFGAIAELTNAYILGTAVHFAYSPVSPEQLREAWASTRERYPFLVAETGSAFAGYAKSGQWRSREAYDWTTEVGVYVTPRSQGQGVGRALYTRLLEELRCAGFRSAIGGITLPNPASVRLHESLGFAHVGTVKEAGFKLGAWHDVAFYQRMLHAAT